jgi:hypothetical protein
MRSWEQALSRLEDRIANSVDGYIAAHPQWDRWLEVHLHAYGLHGPQARYLLKTRVFPLAALLTFAVLFLLVLLIVRRVRRSHRRRRRSPLSRPHPLPR